MRKTETSRKRAFNRFAALLQKQMDEERREHERKIEKLVRTTKKDMIAALRGLGVTDAESLVATLRPPRKRNQQ